MDVTVAKASAVAEPASANREGALEASPFEGRCEPTGTPAAREPHRFDAPRSLRAKMRRPLMLGVPCLLAVLGVAYYVAQEPYVWTDDAFVRAAKDSVNARVGGQVVAIVVRDNQ